MPSRMTGLSLARSFCVAALFVLAALGPELFVVKRFFPYPFLFLFFGAVVLSAWFAGMAAGLFAVLLSIMAVDYFFIPPVYSFVFNAAAGMYLAAFVVCALIATWLSSSKKRNEEALKEARDQLERRVEERTAALMKKEADLARLSRMLSMGELAASIAHEIKQPLTAVVMNGHACIEWLSAAPPNTEKARQTAKRIIEDGNRAGAVLSRIRAMFKNQSTVKDWIDINEVIQEILTLVRGESQILRIPVHAELSPGLPRMKGDRVQLQQVVLNLVMNAMDAMAGTPATTKKLLVRCWNCSGQEIAVKVEDTGVGLAPEIMEKVFDPFFTTKAHGIGMGLSISRSIIESHHGRLWAEPRPGGGTIFQFVVPIEPPTANE